MRKMAERYQCIYCLEIKYENNFNREHVFHDSFGQYEQSLVLHNQVCKSCNQYFGDTIDNKFARNTYEGFQRFKAGVKSPQEFCTHKHSKNSSLVSIGRLKGLEWEKFYDLDSKTFKVHPTKDDIGLKKADGFYTFFPIKDLPSKEAADAQYPRQNGRILILLPEKAGLIIATIEKKWQERLLTKHYDMLSYDEFFDFEERFECTKSVLFRAIAKIAFNYLAYHNKPQVALQKCFNPIRDFILKGIGEPDDYVQTEKRPILHEENNQAVEINIVTLANNNREIESSVAVLNRIHYRVCLTKNYDGITLKAGFGHGMDPHSRHIHEMSQSSLVLCRKMQSIQIIKTPWLILMPVQA